MNREKYKEYEARVAHFLKEEGLTSVSSTGDENEFSWTHCECCGSSFGGSRYTVSGYAPETREVFEYEVCDDCLYYLEYGRLDDQTMMDMEEN